MENQTKKKQLKYYNLSEVEEFIEEYQRWYNERKEAQTQDASGSNPGGEPPPPPGSQP